MYLQKKSHQNLVDDDMVLHRHVVLIPNIDFYVIFKQERIPILE